MVTLTFTYTVVLVFFFKLLQMCFLFKCISPSEHSLYNQGRTPVDTDLQYCDWFRLLMLHRHAPTVYYVSVAITKESNTMQLLGVYLYEQLLCFVLISLIQRVILVILIFTAYQCTINTFGWKWVRGVLCYRLERYTPKPLLCRLMFAVQTCLHVPDKRARLHKPDQVLACQSPTPQNTFYWCGNTATECC